MLEKIIIKLATLLIEKFGAWLIKRVRKRKLARREHARVANAVRRLQEAHEESEIAAASDSVP